MLIPSKLTLSLFYNQLRVLLVTYDLLKLWLIFLYLICVYVQIFALYGHLHHLKKHNAPTGNTMIIQGILPAYLSFSWHKP